MTFFGLKYSHNQENWAAHPHQEFAGVPHRKDYQKASKSCIERGLLDCRGTEDLKPCVTSVTRLTV